MRGAQDRGRPGRPRRRTARWDGSGPQPRRLIQRRSCPPAPSRCGLRSGTARRASCNPGRGRPGLPRLRGSARSAREQPVRLLNALAPPVRRRSGRAGARLRLPRGDRRWKRRRGGVRGDARRTRAGGRRADTPGGGLEWQCRLGLCRHCHPVPLQARAGPRCPSWCAFPTSSLWVEELTKA